MKKTQPHQHSRYDIAECTVTRHAQYGLIIESLSGERGYVENEYIGDTPLPAEYWPKVGEHMVGVVLGYTSDGRLRLCTQPSYVDLIRSASDPRRALSAWTAIRSADEEYMKTTEALTGSSEDMTYVLRWALSQRPSSDHDVAVRAMLNAPTGLKLEFIPELVTDIIEDYHAEIARTVIASIGARQVTPALRRSVESLVAVGSSLKLDQYFRLIGLFRELSARDLFDTVVSAMLSIDNPAVLAAARKLREEYSQTE